MSRTKNKNTDNCIFINDDDGRLILSDNIIKKANQLITGRHKISAIEQKIFNLSLSKVTFDKQLGRPVAEITVKEMREILNCKGNSIYKHIQNLSRTLRDRTIIVNNLENDEFLMIGLINVVEYKSGVMRLKFEPEATDLVWNLKSDYTKLNLSLYKNLNNIYAIRLYEILKSNIYKCVDELSITYGINNLKWMIGMIQINDTIHKALIRNKDIEEAIENSPEADSLRDISNFKRALNTAIGEINEVTDIYVEYSTIKGGKGGKVRAINFNVTDKDNLKKIKVKSDDIKKQDKPSEDEILEMIVELKINIKEKLTIENYKQLLECANYNVDLILEKYEQSKKTKKIDNLVAWLTCAIKENYKTTSKNNTSESSSNQSDKPKNKFNDFQQRNYSDDEIADLEKKLLNK